MKGLVLAEGSIAARPVLQHLRHSKRGLLVQLAGLGDLIMALPTIQSLQAALPHVQWSLLTRPANRGLLTERLEAVRTMPWPPSVSNARTIAPVVWQLRQRRFDVAIHLYGITSRHGALAMQTLFLGLHARLSIGRSGASGGRIFDVNWEENTTTRHEVDVNLAMVRSLGVSPVVTVPVLSPQSASFLRVAKILHARFAPRTSFITLFPGGARATRHWPVPNYAALAAALSRMDMGVCVIGDRLEKQPAQYIADAAGDHGLNLAGCLSLQDVAALLSMALVYVGNDSGPTHLAAALGVPCMALFGPGDLSRFGPRGPGVIRVLRHEVACSPCYLQTCSHHTCMRALTIGEVFQALLEVLAHLPGAWLPRELSPEPRQEDLQNRYDS